jgi:predicted XRE-type DNA-binding protein
MCGIIVVGDNMQIKFKVVCNIESLLKRDNVKQVRLAEAIGATRQQVGRWIRGELPHIGYVLRMHDKYGWTLREMFTEFGEEDGK